MGILRFKPRSDGVQVDDAEAIKAIELEKKRVKRFILPTILIILLFLVLMVVSMTSYEWYVADVTGCEWVDDGVFVPSHFGLLAQQYDLGEMGRGGASYQGQFEELSHHVIARNSLYIFLTVFLMSIPFMFLVGRMEDGLEKGGSKWSFLLPSLVGTTIPFLFYGGLLYFYMGFEDALFNDMGEGIDRSTAGYGWPLWILASSGPILILAIALSYWLGWRATGIIRQDKADRSGS